MNPTDKKPYSEFVSYCLLKKNIKCTENRGKSAVLREHLKQKHKQIKGVVKVNVLK